jgi:hypothetical protein
MASQAKRADVFQVAFAATLSYRQNMIGIPQALADSGFHSPMFQERHTPGAARASQPDVFLDGVDSAVRTAASVALEYLLSQVSRLRAQFPFMDAIF